MLATARSGYELLYDPLLNKGTAFTDAERNEFELHGLLPPNVATLDEQVARRYTAFQNIESDLEKYIFLRGLQDTNETVFYALLVAHLEEMLPIIYTPTVGLGCERFSHLFRKPRGLFLAWPNRHRIESILQNPRFDGVEAIVVTDGERVLGLGDQGAGGMGIPIGKLALYTACGGLHPSTTLPVLLDVGTDNAERLGDSIYVGWRHPRVRGADYDDFIETFVAAVTKRWPHVLLQWEDFAQGNAARLLDRYRGRLCTFNDDIQGTAAAVLGALLSAVRVTGLPLVEHRVAVLGAGSAGCGISALLMAAMVEQGLSPAAACARLFLVDKSGLLLDGAATLLPFQRPFARPRDAVSGWALQDPSKVDMVDVVANARPTVLIGVSGQGGAFPETLIRAMASRVERPVIFPLSNPTTRSEASPADLDAWSGGRAVIGTGSPFPPIIRSGRRFSVDQTNNAYVFPGIGLGAIAAQARCITQGMFMAAAHALADASPAQSKAGAHFLPPIADLRQVSFHVAQAVAARAQLDGVAPPCGADELVARIRTKMWAPAYRRYRRSSGRSPP
jgi:malate dehydrogenase (oxaloacetate-decarboxylating)